MNIFFSPRLVSILKLLADRKDFVPTAFLAEALDISTRTIFREIKNIDYLLTPFGISLEAKSGHGYFLHGSEASIKYFLNVLDASADIISWSSVEDRRNLVMIECLQMRGSIKLATLAQLMSVSEGTISRDLAAIEPLIAAYGLKLERRQGHGLEIIGEEENIRKAIVDYIHERLNLEQNPGHNTKENLYRYFEDQSSGILSLLDKDVLNDVIDVLSYTSVNIINKITEHSIIGLIIHITVAIERIRNGEEITLDDSILESMKQDAMYRDANIIAVDIEDRFNITFPKAEIGYILMHLRGTRPRYVNEELDIGSVLPNYEMMMLVEQLVLKFSSIINQKFTDDEMLITGLMAHIIPSINRMKNHLDIRNPLLKEIKSQYPELFDIVKESSKILAVDEDFQVSDDEVAYLTLHFGAAIERGKSKLGHSKLNLGVVCASGIGISSLLSSKIKSTFPDVDKVQPLSVEQVLAKDYQGIDLLVATLDIKAEIPIVYVKALLTDEDVKLIKSAVQKIKTKSRDINVNLFLNNFDEKIIEDIMLQDLDLGLKKEDILEILVARASKEPLIQQDILNSVKAREKQSTVVIHEKRFVMYHASVESLVHPVVIFFRDVGKHKSFDYNEVDIGVFMLIPKPAKSKERVTLSNISKAIVENDELEVAIRSGQLSTIKSTILKNMEAK